MFQSFFSRQIDFLHHVIRINPATDLAIEPKIHDLPNPRTVSRKYLRKQIRLARPQPFLQITLHQHTHRLNTPTNPQPNTKSLLKDHQRRSAIFEKSSR